MHRADDLGISTGHTRSDTFLQGFETGEDGLLLQDGEQVCEQLQSRADIGVVGLR